MHVLVRDVLRARAMARPVVAVPLWAAIILTPAAQVRAGETATTGPVPVTKRDDSRRVPPEAPRLRAAPRTAAAAGQALATMGAAPDVASFIELLAELPDPRMERTRRHSLEAISLLVPVWCGLRSE